jgi:serine phosphatase RsbU (regulator of sigma subunit)/tetratricopeptide (TPR) repeat protein
LKRLFHSLFFGLLAVLAHAQDRGSLLARLQEARLPAEKIQVLGQLATLAKQSQQVDPAIAYHKQALALAEEAGQPSEVGRLSLSLADLHLEKQEYDLAIGYALQALSVYEKCKQVAQVADVQYYIGQVYKESEAYDKAIGYLEKALAHYQETNNIFLQKKAIFAIAEAHFHNQQLDEAEKRYAGLVGLARLTNDPETEVGALAKVSVVCASNKHYDEAIGYTRELASAHERAGNLQPLALAHQNLGYLFRQKGDLAASEAQFGLAIATFGRIKDPNATVLANTAVTYTMLANFTKAEDYYLQAIEVARKQKDAPDLADKYNLIGANSLLAQNPFQAIQYVQQAIELATPVNAHKQLSDSYLLLNEIYTRQNDFKAAQDAFRKAGEYTKKREAQQAKQQAALLQRRMEAEERENDLLLLMSEKEKQKLTLHQALLEAEKKEQEFALLRKERDLQEVTLKNQLMAKEQAEQQLQLASQQLETARQKQQILHLNQQKILNDLALQRQQATQDELRRTAELEKKQNEIRNLQLGQQLNTQRARERMWLYGGLAGLLLVMTMGWATWRTYKQRQLIQAKNAALEQQQREIQGMNEELRTSEEEIRQNAEELQATNEQLGAVLTQVNEQKNVIEAKNSNITASITYAKRIQQSFLPQPETLQAALGDYCLFYQPKDIVSGDFYWLRHLPDGRVIFAVVDCTGHGVPGAFMSLIGNNLLKEIVDERKVYSPDLILNELHLGIKHTLQQEKTANRDGMDLTLVLIDQQQGLLEFAGAKNGLVYCQNGELISHKGDRYEIGGYASAHAYNKYQIQLSPTEPTTIYLFSDGFQDQFGGDNKSRFSARRLKELLFSIHQQPMAEQSGQLAQAFAEWQGDNGQIDDVCVVGFRA